MLSRTADHLFWMSRYQERAESTARMLDAHARLSLLPRPAEAVLQGWTATLVSLGKMEPYAERYQQVTPRSAFDFLAFDTTNPNSILSCLRATRENARAVRGTLTSELWETLNTTYLESRAVSARLPEAARLEFLEWVKYRSHIARGITSSTMQRDEALCFTRIGAYLERADNTTRMLEARWRDPGGQGERLNEEASEWAVLLRAMSAFETYRRICRTQVTPKQVTELLLMRDDVPQAVHRCLAELQRDLKTVANARSQETLRRAGELHAQFHYGRLDELAADGITVFFDHFQQRLRDLGQRIAEDFLVPLGAE
ncbi:MAG TPA: alpha-E domain-containing protein [Steroidobacteraceae bacterium]|nr:alpha-E domain-containing protein [Steroidobacteraceae bacterium]